jgi:hypothetical protein
MHAAGRGLSQQVMQAALKSFEGLNPGTARRVVRFYERRGKRAVEANARNVTTLAPAASDIALRTVS